MVDIIIAVLLGALTLLTAYLGVHVTLHPPQTDTEKFWYKGGFCVSGVLACSFIGVQAYRNHVSQAALTAQMGRIETNTKEPPKVQVNVPPTQIVFQQPSGPVPLPEFPGERHVGNGQIEKIKAALQPFPKQKVAIVTLAHSQERMRYAGELETAFSQAGWYPVRENLERKPDVIVDDYGVMLLRNSQSNPDEKPVTAALIAAKIHYQIVQVGDPRGLDCMGLPLISTP